MVCHRRVRRLLVLDRLPRCDRAGGPPRAPAEAEFEALIEANLTSMTSRARQLCRGNLDPDDLVQEAVLRACQRHEQLRDPASARAWLVRILERLFVDTVRRQRVRNEVFLAVEPPDMPPDEPAVPAPWQDVTQDEVRAAIARLPDDLRVTYLLFTLEDRSYADIAARLAIPRATVGTRIHRARRHLRALLGSPGAEKQ